VVAVTVAVRPNGHLLYVGISFDALRRPKQYYYAFGGDIAALTAASLRLSRQAFSIRSTPFDID
jgi:hypothetical protein